MAEESIIKKYAYDVNRDSNFSFPDRRIEPRLKTEPGYCLQIARATLGWYLGDLCGVPFTGITMYDETRAYSNGKQDPSKYDHFYPSGEEDNRNNHYNNKRKGDGNLNKEIMSPAPQLKLAIKGTLSEIDYNVVADTIDPDSIFEKKMKMSESLAIGSNVDFLNQFNKSAALPEYDSSKYPRDTDELKLMEEMGEFKTPVSMALQELIKHTFDISDWEIIRDRLIDDAVDHSMFTIKLTFDQESSKWKPEYVDCTRLIVQYSDRRDCSDSGFVGQIRMMKLYEIRPQLERDGYTEEQIKAVAYSWCGQADFLGAWGGPSNPASNKFDEYLRQDTYGNWLYDYWNVLVLDWTWIENDDEYKDYKPNNITGEMTPYRGNFGKVKENTVVTTIKRKYEAKWVINTNYIFDQRVSPSQPWDANNKRPLMDYIIHIDNEKSITHRCKPAYDLFQITWLKLQNENSTLHSEIDMIDMTILQRAALKGGMSEITKMLTRMKETGKLIYNSLGPKQNYPGGSVDPIKRIPSTMLTHIEEAVTMFNQSFKLIEMVTGINPAFLGSQPGNREAVQNVEMAIESTQKILKPMILGLMHIKEDSAEFLSEAIPLACRNDKNAYEAYMRVTKDAESLRQSTYTATELGIKLRPKPTTAELQSLQQDINKFSMPGQDGNILLTPDMELRIREMIQHGADLTHVRIYLTDAIKKAKDHAEQVKQQNIQQQNDGNLRLKQSEVDGDIAREKAKGDNKLKEIEAEYQAKMKLEWQKQSHERQMFQLQNQKQPEMQDQ